MNIRQKTLLLVIVTLTSLIMIILASVSSIILQSFAKLEEENTKKNIQRVQEVLNEESSKLNLTVKDWAGWDDTYLFAQNENQDYIEKNLYEDVFDNLQINLFLLYNKKQQEIVKLGYDLENHKFNKLPVNFFNYLNSHQEFFNFENDQDVLTGFILQQKDLFLIVARPILTSELKGPNTGTLIMGRLINNKKIKDIERKTKLAIKLHLIEDLSSDLKIIFQSLNQDNLSNQIIIKNLNAQEIAGYFLMKDWQNQPIILWQVTLPRDIYQQGKKSLFLLILSLLLCGFVFIILMVVLIDKLIVNRLMIIDHSLKKIGETNDLSLRVSIKGKDELANFAQTVNWVLDELHKEKEKTEKLLLNVLPETIALQLKNDHNIIAQDFENVSILFADLVGFTQLAGRLSPLELVNFLNNIFSNFDYLAEQLGLEKIKTIGDAYMVACGLPKPRDDHAEAIAKMALEMNNIIEEISLSHHEKFEIRIGINTGKVVAGVIGKKRFIYDLWGDAVNIASRMESSGEAGKIQVTETTYQLLKNQFILTKRGLIDIKGKGQMVTYWLEDIAP